MVCAESVLARRLIQDLQETSREDTVVESEAVSMRDLHVVDDTRVAGQPVVGSDENERFAYVLDALEHDLAQSPAPSVLATSGEVRIAHREYESTGDTTSVVDMTVDDSDHEVPGPLRGNRFALLNDHDSDLNE